MTCNDKCIHYPVCEMKNYDFANIDKCDYYNEERPRGEWISRRYINGADWAKSFDMKVCNCCNYEFSYDAETGISDANFCPNCGAKMKGGDEE